MGKPIRARHAAGEHAAAECVSGNGAPLGSVSGTAGRSLSSPPGDRTRIPIWAGRPVEDRHSGVHPAGGSTQIPVWARTWPEPRAAEASVPRHDPARPPVAGPDSAGPDRPVAVASAPARSDQEARQPAADPLRRFAHDPGSGTQLPSSVEEALRPSFGPGIGAVRVHTDPAAEGAARHARAGLYLRRAHRLRDNPFTLDISAWRAQQIQSGERDFALDRPAGFDVDEPLPVGAPDVSRARAVDRAMDPHNRQLLDPATNQRTKYLGTSSETIARHRTHLAPVSAADEPAALFTRRFDEVTELPAGLRRGRRTRAEHPLAASHGDQEPDQREHARDHQRGPDAGGYPGARRAALARL